MTGVTQASPGGHTVSVGPLGSLRRGLAVALLPLSIVPVVLFGRPLLRAPEKLWREAQAEVGRPRAPRHVPVVKQAARRVSVAARRVSVAPRRVSVAPRVDLPKRRGTR